MRKLVPLGVLLVVLGGAVAAYAQDASGTLTVNFTVASSFKLILKQGTGGVALSPSSGSAVTADLGTISFFGGCATTGVTCTPDGAEENLTVATTFAVRVNQANSPSLNYDLKAALQSADATNTWKVNSVELSTSAATVQSGLAYRSDIDHTLNIVVPYTATAGGVSKVINLEAYAN